MILQKDIKGNCQLVIVPINKFKIDLTDIEFRKILDLIKNNYEKKNTNNKIIKFINMSQIEKRKIKKLFYGIKEREIERRTKDNIEYDNVNFALDFDYDHIDILIKKHKNRCALTNVELSWKPNELNTASIDRIDSTKGYSKDNIQLVMWYANSLKGSMHDSEVKIILDNIANN